MSFLAVIEIENADRLRARFGVETFTLLSNELKQRLDDWVREQDQIAVDKSGRLCVLLRGVKDEGQIHLAARKLKRLTEAEYDCFGNPVHLKVSVGFTRVEAAPDNTHAAVSRASSAMQHARQSNQFYALYQAERPVRDQLELQLVEQLTTAVGKGEFTLYFQPKMHAVFRNLVGAEALVRWVPDGSKVIPPGEFMPIAERHGVIKPLTEWVLKSAVSRCVRWGGDVGVAVNIAPSVLQDDELYYQVSDSLDLYGLEAERLTLEVTESIMADNQQVMFEQLTRLRQLGVRVALDDFGTGYCSFAYFRNLPADELKIDQMFVRAMDQSSIDAAIVKSIVELAKNCGLTVVAEGVEDEACAERLRDIGCDVLQGYLFDKPLPAEELEKRHQLSQHTAQAS